MNMDVPRPVRQRAQLGALLILSVTHLLNDMIQSLIPAIYPIIKQAYHLDFGQIGFITLTFQVMASLFQPVVGYYTDKNPMPYSTVVGMASTLGGLIGLAFANSYHLLLVSAAFVGLGSSIFHPEATRMARSASGGQHGFAQGIFQVGGQSGSALGPLLAAFIIVPRGQSSLAWFSLSALVAIALMIWTARRQMAVPRQAALEKTSGPPVGDGRTGHSQATMAVTIAILIVLLFSKNAYTASFTSFYTFYLIEKFGVSVQASQMMLFLFLASSAVGVLAGGIVGDRIGRYRIIWFSILGALPFTLMLPYADLVWTGVLTVVINLIMASAFAAILIYAMELMPGRIGMIGGLFYGLTFGLGGLAAAFLGQLADGIGVSGVYQICSFLPIMGLLCWFLPQIEERSISA